MGSGASALEKTKALGNQHYAEGKFRLAAKFYSKALHYDPDNQALLSNRSAAYLKLGKPGLALQDALRCLQVASDWTKTYFRLAAALAELRLPKEAGYYAQIALALSPKDVTLQALVESLKGAIDRSSTLEWGQRVRPRPVEALAGVHFADLSCGVGHVVAVTDSGEVFVWGDNSHHQCGVDCSSAQPTLVPTLIGKQTYGVACGGAHSLVLCRSGAVYAWGANALGQCCLPNQEVPYPTLVPMQFTVKGVAAGFGHTVFVSSTGQAHTCGWNSCGQLGRGLAASKADLGVVSTLRAVTQVSCGGAHTLFVCEGGKLWSVGSNSCGQLGLGHERDEKAPQQVGGLAEVALACCGEEFSSAVTSQYDVYTFGLGNVGQLGNGGKASASCPVLVRDMSRALRTLLLACTKAQVLAVTDSGHVYSWGLVEDLESTAAVRKPTLVTALKAKDVRDIRCMRESFFISLRHATASECFVTGLGVERIPAGKRAVGVLHLRDRDGVFLTAPGERVSATIVDVDGFVLKDTEVECYWESNRYELSVRASKAGHYEVYVFCNNQPLRNVAVTVAPRDAVRCRGSLLVTEVAGSAENMVRGR